MQVKNEQQVILITKMAIDKILLMTLKGFRHAIRVMYLVFNKIIPPLQTHNTTEVSRVCAFNENHFLC